MRDGHKQTLLFAVLITLLAVAKSARIVPGGGTTDEQRDPKYFTTGGHAVYDQQQRQSQQQQQQQPHVPPTTRSQRPDGSMGDVARSNSQQFVPVQYFDNKGQFALSLIANWMGPDYRYFATNKAIKSHWTNYLSRAMHDEQVDEVRRSMYVAYMELVDKAIAEAPFAYWLTYMIDYYFAAVVLVYVPLIAAGAFVTMVVLKRIKRGKRTSLERAGLEAEARVKGPKKTS